MVELTTGAPIRWWTYRWTASVRGRIWKLLAGEVDFGASESPQAIRDLAPAQQDGYLLPSVVGAVVPIVNLPGFPTSIALTPQCWPEFISEDHQVERPPSARGEPRRLAARSRNHRYHSADGSGTSYAWTDYLSKISPEWQAEVGAGLTPRWLRLAATGNDGAAKLVKELGGSIGYVEFIYALEYDLSFAKVRKPRWRICGREPGGMAIAASQSLGADDNFKISIVDPPGRGAYPISTFTWFIIPKDMPLMRKERPWPSFWNGCSDPVNGKLPLSAIWRCRKIDRQRRGCPPQDSLTPPACLCTYPALFLFFRPGGRERPSLGLPDVAIGLGVLTFSTWHRRWGTVAG